MDTNNQKTNQTETQLDASMKSVPVFTIAKEGKIQKLPFKDAEVLMFFLDYDDAVAQLFELNMQTEKAEELSVHPLSLLDFLIIMQQTQAKNDAKIILKPHRNSINQIKLLTQKNKVEKMPNMRIPLFFARNKKNYMSINSQNQNVIPMFLDPIELNNAIKKNTTKEENMQIDVEFLESLLGKASKDDSLKQQFVIVPSQTQSLRAQMLVQK